jgi:hypothetical protein
MAARGSGRVADALGELLAELPERMRGSQAKLSEQAVAALKSFAERFMQETFGRYSQRS